MTHRSTLCMPAIVLALVATPAPALDWQPGGELGAVLTTGNSDTLSVNGKLALKTADDPTWLNDHYALFLRSRQDDLDTAERYELGSKVGYRFDERRHVFGALRYENDEFSPYEYQASLSGGYGWHAVKSEPTSLLFEIGPGFRIAEPVAGATENSPIARGYGDFQHKVNDNVSVFNTLLAEASGDNTFLQNDVGVAVKINASLALKAALQARHNTDAPAQTDRTDTLTTLNLVWTPHQ